MWSLDNRDVLSQADSQSYTCPFYSRGSLNQAVMGLSSGHIGRDVRNMLSDFNLEVDYWLSIKSLFDNRLWKV